jgi:ribosome maturation factor RimP
MNRKNIINKLEKIIEPILSDLGIELVDIEYVREPKGLMLRIFIDKEGGVDLGTCVQVNEELSPHLDVEGFIKQHYHLEVSSPGIERHLRKKRDFEKHIEKEIKVKTFEPVNERRNFKGLLKDVDEVGIRIQCDNKIYDIEFINISKASLVAEIKF